MAEKDVIYITEEGLQALQAELEHLTTVKRLELSDRLQKAIGQGDLSENADYHDAKQEQGFLEGRILELQNALRRAQVIEDHGLTDRVRVGSTVTVIADGEATEETYRIVGVHEAAPGNGLISNESPFGRALLGAKVGDTVRVTTPGGGIDLKVKAIS
ncbi:MAG: transcription elongation factor GreA [Anaerolineae bacterium]|nr:transcription elongation factor GreA [Anaerolineae bacterium]